MDNEEIETGEEVAEIVEIEANTPDAGEKELERRRNYDEFMSAHKDYFLKDTQKIINRRFKEFKTLQRELEDTKERLRKLTDGDTHSRLLSLGIDPEAAEFVLDFKTNVEKIKSAAYSEAVKSTLDTVRSRGMRAGESAHVARTFSRNVSTLSKSERAALARRSLAGENVKF